MPAQMDVDQDLGVPNRIHVVPMGFEEERVFEPLRAFKADRAIIISHTGNKEGGDFSQHYSRVEEEADSIGVDLVLEKCDIFDVYDSIRAIGEAVSAHAKDEVYVNLSAGSKITAIAGMIACMSSNAVPYYAQADDYSGDVPSEVSKISSLPQLEINPPTADEIAVLSYLSDEGPATKGELIKFGQSEGLDFLSDFDGKEKARYRRLDRHVVSSLSESGYVDTYRKGRRVLVEITETGEKAFKAFRYLVGKGKGQVETDQEVLHSFDAPTGER